MLNVLDLHTYYGDSHVLQGVTMHVDTGTVTAILGRNGVGKTTLCRSLVGLTPARAGRIVFDGTEITRLPPHRICGMRISLVPQGRRIFPSLTVEENLAIAARTQEPLAGSGSVSEKPEHASSRPASPAKTPLIRRTAARAARLLGARSPSLGRAPSESWDVRKVYAVFPRLSERSGHRGDELSGGEQQMLAIARALVANPVLLVMDEPTEGLAPMLVAEVGKLIRRLKDEGTSILLVEQNAAFAVKTADYVHVMSKGQIVHSSEPAALWANPVIKTQFLGLPRVDPGVARDVPVERKGR